MYNNNDIKTVHELLVNLSNKVSQKTIMYTYNNYKSYKTCNDTVFSKIMSNSFLNT